MHKLLRRQLHRLLGLDDESQWLAFQDDMRSEAVPEGMSASTRYALQHFGTFLQRVDDTYAEHDRMIDMRIRSLEISSGEMLAANEELRVNAESRELAIGSLREAANMLLAPMGQSIGDDDTSLERLTQLLARLVSDFAASQSSEASAISKLRESERTLRLLTDNIEEVFWMRDASVRTMVYISPAYEQVWGRSCRSLYEDAESFLEAVHPDDRPALRAVLSTGAAFAEEYRIVRPDGSIRWILDRGFPVSDGTDDRVLIAGAAKDITDRKELAAQLRDSQKMEAIGQLTGGLAHDFNNLLGIILGNLDMIEEELPGDVAPLLARLEAARDAALRGAEVTRSLLAVARRQKLEVRGTDINALLTDLVPLIRASAGSAVSVNTQLAPEALVSQIDSGGLNNAILNLVINARDAMQARSGRHTLQLRTRRQHIADGADVVLASGNYAVVEVRDNGPGMSEAVKAQAFEPFFTTKDPGKGTGLGLAMVRGYVEQLGGTARVESAVGAGTTVRLYLPLDEEAVRSADASEASRLASLRGLEVLDTPPEEAFDAIVAEAARVCGAPIALVSLVDEHRQWFKAAVGLEVSETPRIDSFCAHTVLQSGQPLVVTDALRDARFSGNPLVTGDPGIRFYAGVPLHDATQQVLGTLCVIDRRPRDLDAPQQAQLAALAERVAGLLRARVPATTAPRFVEPAVPTPTAAAPRALRRVLVVDDEQDLCDLAGAWLHSMGYEVTSALSPQEALVHLAAQRFDVLFTDVVMPGPMDGVELARVALQGSPGLRVLFASGYARNVNDQTILPGAQLNKPYRKKDLAAVFSKLTATTA